MKISYWLVRIIANTSKATKMHSTPCNYHLLTSIQIKQNSQTGALIMHGRDNALEFSISLIYYLCTLATFTGMIKMTILVVDIVCCYSNRVKLLYCRSIFILVSYNNCSRPLKVTMPY